MRLSTQYRNITTHPTEEEVFVGDRKVGTIFDCGDCWRVSPSDKRRSVVRSEDYDTRDFAIAFSDLPAAIRRRRTAAEGDGR